MLRGLTERPNVQSTLILSRKDGSIIRVTGIAAPGERGSSASATAYQWPQVEKSKGAADASEQGRSALANESDEPSDVHNVDKPVERLASSIFQFVNNANVMGATLGAASRNTQRPEGTYTGAVYGEAKTVQDKERNTEEDAENGNIDDEVQLLRLRTKHQEIIIFPDSNYICCVVQRIGKIASGHDRR
ncbi:uncharacterized protein Z520_06163 [Fonsecaea multimorphosa CBS 102226]|uniref:Roadblock/LAMTOR2 domain-containing protein n=1 Tax=Fonsecaea multimorphosa CBS 102226 TaxID=1442371 RepID=A0A0D2KN08_9EURO|nr:uncharacterized protein Z520_06163 [Fonsecaea multimorphosa CBS 102226]KIX98083.1 hypothetical protein Z520_06163 [Fonsecaea multimorphosa CBS 102226]OAL24167.1 hypothetical protein AYO22_05826 [Fonsecaea multimorphosa]